MNVIVIVNDSLRVDHVGCYGNKWIKTPNIDKLAKESAVFDYAYSEGLPTLPTRTAFFTGRYTFPFRGWQRLEPTDILLAEVLWDKGYNSALITDTYHMHKPGMAYERGFDFVQWIRGQEEDPVELDKSIPVDLAGHYKSDREGKDTRMKAQIEQYLRNTRHWKSDEDRFVAQVVKAGIRWLENQQRKDNLFLWLDCFDPHEPWDPCPPYDTMYTDPNFKGVKVSHPIPGEVEGYMTPEEVNNTFKLYAGEVTICDKWVGILLDKIKQLGLYDNSLIVYTTDHGEPFGEHGIIRKAKPYPYEELVHIPWMVRHPKGIGAGKRFDAIIETCDMMPTILDFLQVKAPPRMHGQSILPIMSGQKQKIRDYAYVGHFRESWRINDHEWAYIMWHFDRKNELYNMKKDPAEKKNLIDENPVLAMEMELKLRRFVEKLT